MESSETSKVFFRSKSVEVDRHRVNSERITPLWKFESLIRGISSGFPLANRLALPGSKSVYSTSQDPPRLTHSLNQDGF